MEPISLFLVTIAGIFLVGVAGELVFRATSIPDVVWLIAVGILLGPISGWVDREQLAKIAPYFGAVTLVIVLFDGGSRLRLSELSRAAPRSSLLALSGFLSSVLLMAAASVGASKLGLLPESWSWGHGLLLGGILGGSSSVVIMPAMQYAGLDPKLSNLVNLESALTDVLCVVVTGALITTLSGGSVEFGGAVAALARSFAIGLAIGLTTGLLWIVLHRLWNGSDHEYPVTLGALLLLYVVINWAGGSAALGILAAAVLMGNAGGISKRLGMAEPAQLDPRLQDFHRHVTFMIKSFFFTFIGVMFGPPWSLVMVGLLFGGGLLLARYPAVAMSLAGKDFSSAERGLIRVALPRGMAAGVLAMMPSQAGIAGTEQLPTIVFASVLTTILIFAVGFPLMRSRLAAISPTQVFQAEPPQPEAAGSEVRPT